MLAPAESAPLLLPEPGELTMTPLHGAVLTALEGGGGLFFRMLGDRVARVLDGHPVDDGDLVSAVWDLVWAGLLTNDTLAPLRVLTSGGADPTVGGCKLGPHRDWRGGRPRCERIRPGRICGIRFDARRAGGVQPGRG